MVLTGLCPGGAPTGQRAAGLPEECIQVWFYFPPQLGFLQSRARQHLLPSRVHCLLRPHLSVSCLLLSSGRFYISSSFLFTNAFLQCVVFLLAHPIFFFNYGKFRNLVLSDLPNISFMAVRFSVKLKQSSPFPDYPIYPFPDNPDYLLF